MEISQTCGDTLLVLTNLPDDASAQALATALVSERLAACVNILAPCRSTYRWQNAIENEQGGRNGGDRADFQQLGRHDGMNLRWAKPVLIMKTDVRNAEGRDSSRPSAAA